jgi:hypothetical protein
MIEQDKYKHLKAFENLIDNSKDGQIYIPLTFELILEALKELQNQIEIVKGQKINDRAR